MKKHIVGTFLFAALIIAIFVYGVYGYGTGNIAQLAGGMFVSGLLSGLMWGYTIFVLFTKQHTSVFELEDGWK